MSGNNFERMMAIITEVFDTRNDPEQLQVDESVIEALQKIHPATLSEFADENGPAIWILIIPTTDEVMHLFLENKISEQGIMERTKPGMTFEAIYLCSASVLPEYRRKGMAKKLCIDAINAIRTDHPIKSLYVWPFTEGGNGLAEKIAEETGLTLFKKTHEEK